MVLLVREEEGRMCEGSVVWRCANDIVSNGFGVLHLLRVARLALVKHVGGAFARATPYIIPLLRQLLG